MLLFFCFLFLSVISNARGVNFTVSDFESEADALAALSSDTIYECEAVDVSEALAKNWFDTTAELINICRDLNVDTSSAFYQQANIIRSQLKELTTLLGIKKGQKRIISPAFEWTQSDSNVLLNVKMSHKIDTPATLGCLFTNENIVISNTSLLLQAPCPIQHKTFELKIDLYEAIDPQESSWTEGSVGRLTFELRKKETEKNWIQLLKEGSKIHNMHVWWTMKAQLVEEAKIESQNKKEREKEEREEREKKEKEEKDKKDKEVDNHAGEKESEKKVEEKREEKKDEKEKEKKSQSISNTNKMCSNKTKELDKKKDEMIKNMEKLVLEEKNKLDLEIREKKKVLNESFESSKEKIMKKRDESYSSLRNVCKEEIKEASKAWTLFPYTPNESKFDVVIESFQKFKFIESKEDVRKDEL